MGQILRFLPYLKDRSWILGTHYPVHYPDVKNWSVFHYFCIKKRFHFLRIEKNWRDPCIFETRKKYFINILENRTYVNSATKNFVIWSKRYSWIFWIKWKILKTFQYEFLNQKVYGIPRARLTSFIFCYSLTFMMWCFEINMFIFISLD